MIRLFLFCLTLNFWCIIPSDAQERSSDKGDSTSIIYHKVVAILKANALGTSYVDWPSYERRAEQLFSTGSNQKEVFQLLGAMFSDMGDFHGGFFYDGVRFGMKRPDLNVRMELQEGFRLGAKIRSEMLEGQIGYIFIPPINFSTRDGGRSIGQEIDSIICSISPKARGWIIDLRLNLGGNMYPMIGGLQSLLGEGLIGSFFTGDQKTIAWTVSNGVFKAGTDSVLIANNLCNYETLPVVVLTSQLTASSGEAVAIAFKGREKTVFLGEDTSGYITALNRYQLNSHAMLLVSEANMCDRTGHCYTKNVTPDITLVDGDDFADLKKDAKILRALSLLK